MELDPVILSRLQLLSASLTFQLRRMFLVALLVMPPMEGFGPHRPSMPG